MGYLLDFLTKYQKNMVFLFFLDHRVPRESGGPQLPRQARTKVLPQLAGKRDIIFKVLLV